MKKLLVSFLFFSALSALAEETPLIPVTLKNKRDVQLGTGYDTRKQALKGLCVDNMLDSGAAPATELGQTQGDFVLRFQKSESEVADKLSISGSGRYQSGVYKGGASADFYNEASKSDFKASYTYASELSLRESMVLSRQYPLRPLQGFAGYAKDDIKWYRNCGNEFVSARIKSARLFVNVSVAFVSQSEKDHFNAKFSLETPVLELKTELDKDHKAFSSANTMTVQAYQVGGDPSRLGRIVCPASADDKPDPGCAHGARAVVDCGFGNIGRCTQMIANAVAYANSLDEEGYPTQVKNGEHYVVTALETASYTDRGGDRFKAMPSDNKLEMMEIGRNRVLDIFQKEHKNWIYAKSLSDSRVPRLSVGEREQMDLIQDELFGKMEAASKSIDVCYDGTYKECVDAYPKLAKETGFDKDANMDRTQYAKIFALTKPETFVQYCDMSDSDHPGYRLTVETLRSYAKAALGPQAETLEKGDRCLNLDLWLEAQKEIRLPKPTDPSNPTIGDIGPIATLKNLEVLSLDGQSIKNVDALKALTNLKVLSLDDNLVSDASALAALTGLQNLSMQNNQLSAKSVAKFSALRETLHRLDVRGNRHGDDEEIVCPLASVTNCRIMSFANYADISSAYTKCDEVLHPAAVAIDDTHILATGGRSITEKSARMQLVDNGGCRVLPAALSVPRIGHTMTMTPNGVLVIGGGTNQIELVAPGSFQPTILPGQLAENATNHTATLLPDGRVLVVGGASDADSYAALTKPQSLSGLVQIVNTDGKVETIGRLAVPRAEHTATLLADGTVLILGGYSLNQMIDIAERIDPVAKRIVTLPETLPYGRSGHSATLLENGHVLVAGGSHWVAESQEIKAAVGDKPAETRMVKVLRTVDQLLDFDPRTLKFRVLEEKLSVATTKMLAIPTVDHRVLLIGGQLDAVPLKGELPVRTASSVIQIYDPKTEGIYKVVDMLNRRLGFTATPVGQNSVLIFGGSPSWSVDSAGKVSQDAMTSATELLVYRPR